MKASVSSPWSKRLTQRCALAGLLAWLPVAGMAHDHPADTLQVHGFLSQALVITDHNDFFGNSSDKGSLEYTELGLNASFRPHRRVLVAGQLLSRRAGGDTSDAAPTLDYGVVDYQMLASPARTLGVQVGRFKNPFGLYNQTRDVAFTRPSILLPQSIYFDRTRALGLAADGISLYAEEHTSAGTWRLRGGLGRPQTGSALSDQLFGGTAQRVSASAPSAIAQLLFEDHSGQWVAALSAASVNLEATLMGQEADFEFQPWIASVQYNQEHWSLTAEYALRQQSLSGDHLPRTFDITGESWYVQYQRRFSPDWSGLIRFDRLVNNTDDRSGHAYERARFGPAHSQFADDMTLGVQWTPTSQLMLSGEYHYVDGTGWLPRQDNPDASLTRKHWNMLLFQLSLRF
ncbi:hypothetical protein [Halomonas sp. BC2]|uniref:hypothetical protein n=1 Tax=unclassified Halomonas TaxID=2609666 RepID=UPI002015FDAD|nr:MULTISPECIES: hypothetical protein [unclassified Halomonas]